MYGTLTSGSALNVVELFLDSSTDVIFTGSADGSTDAVHLVLPYAITDGTWHYLAATYNGSTTVAMYLDGQELGVQPAWPYSWFLSAGVWTCRSQR